MTDITQKVEDTHTQTNETTPCNTTRTHTHTHIFSAALSETNTRSTPSSFRDAHLTRADEMGMDDDDDETLGGRPQY